MTKTSSQQRSSQRRESRSSSKEESILSTEELASAMDPAMKAEIEAAVGFLTDFLVKAPKQEFSQESVDLFRRSLSSLLCRQYHGHWHSANPLRGSGFRCLRINGKLDPLVAIAAEASRLPLRKVRQAFPAELTVWIDPGDVSVRFGEEGSVGVWYAARRHNNEEEEQQQQQQQQRQSQKSKSDDHQQLQQQAFAHQMSYQRSSPTLSSTPPGAFPQQYHHRLQFQASPIQYQRGQQSSPVWNPHWIQQQQASQNYSTPQQQQQQQQIANRSSPSSSSSLIQVQSQNGFAMALNHQQQQMQLRQHQARSPIRYTNQTSSSSTPISSRVSPQPQQAQIHESISSMIGGQQETGEEQRCKMLAERLMRENLNLMASLAPGLVSTRPQPVGVGVN